MFDLRASIFYRLFYLIDRTFEIQNQSHFSCFEKALTLNATLWLLDTNGKNIDIKNYSRSTNKNHFHVREIQLLRPITRSVRKITFLGTISTSEKKEPSPCISHASVNPNNSASKYLADGPLPWALPGEKKKRYKFVRARPVNTNRWRIFPFFFIHTTSGVYFTGGKMNLRLLSGAERLPRPCVFLINCRREVCKGFFGPVTGYALNI